MLEIELPAGASFAAADLTAADVDALAAFVDARLRDLLAQHGPGSPRARAALALKVAVDAQFDELRLPFRYDDGEHERLKEKANAWNEGRGHALGRVGLPGLSVAGLEGCSGIDWIVSHW